LISTHSAPQEDSKKCVGMLPNFPGISSATMGLGSPIAEAICWTLADFSIKIESIVAS